MTEAVEALYRRIGQAAVDIAGGEFTRLYVRAEMADSHGSIGLFVDRGGGAYEYATDESDALQDLFAELRAAAGQAGLGRWTQATFALAGSGAFSMQYAFDDISDLGQASARRDAWIVQHLGAEARIRWR